MLIPRVNQPLSAEQIRQLWDFEARIMVIVPLGVEELIQSYGEDGFIIILESHILPGAVGWLSDVRYRVVGLRPEAWIPVRPGSNEVYKRDAEILLEVSAYAHLEEDEDDERTHGRVESISLDLSAVEMQVARNPILMGQAIPIDPESMARPPELQEPQAGGILRSSLEQMRWPAPHILRQNADGLWEDVPVGHGQEVGRIGLHPLDEIQPPVSVQSIPGWYPQPQVEAVLDPLPPTPEPQPETPRLLPPEPWPYSYNPRQADRYDRYYRPR